MAKNILLTDVSDDVNVAVNTKRAELLMQGNDYTKAAVIFEIIREWYAMKYVPKSFSLTGSFKEVSSEQG